jgi:hypothetical protein
MRRAGLTIIALAVGTALSGAAWAQTTGGGGAPTGGAGGVGGAGGAVGAPAGPATPGTAGQNQLTPTMPTGSPTQRSVTGVNQNDQLSTTPASPSDTTTTDTGAGTMPSDAPAGSTTTRTRLGGGTATGRAAKDSNADVASGVEGPGQLSRPTAFELHSGRVPRIP